MTSFLDISAVQWSSSGKGKSWKSGPFWASNQIRGKSCNQRMRIEFFLTANLFHVMVFRLRLSTTSVPAEIPVFRPPATNTVCLSIDINWEFECSMCMVSFMTLYDSNEGSQIAQVMYLQMMTAEVPWTWAAKCTVEPQLASIELRSGKLGATSTQPGKPSTTWTASWWRSTLWTESMS